MKNLDQLMAFKMAAEYANFSKAAKQLGITAAAVGKQIKTLEDELGVQLFYRTTRQVQLTQLGEAFYEQCERILQEVDKTENLIAAHKGIVKGRLKVISSIHFGERYVVPHLAKFLQNHPHLTLDLELADRIPNLETENIDLLFGVVSGLPSHYMQRRLKEDYYCFCASPNYLKQKGKPERPDDLLHHVYITHSKRPDPNTLSFNGTKINLKPQFATNNTDVMLQCCLDGLGIAMLHADIIKKYIQQGLLVEVLEKFHQPQQTLYLYFKKVQYMQPNIRSFIDFVMENVNALI